jgi:hypothetical protein
MLSLEVSRRAASVSYARDENYYARDETAGRRRSPSSGEAGGTDFRPIVSGRRLNLASAECRCGAAELNTSVKTPTRHNANTAAPITEDDQDTPKSTARTRQMPPRSKGRRSTLRRSRTGAFYRRRSATRRISRITRRRTNSKCQRNEQSQIGNERWLRHRRENMHCARIVHSRANKQLTVHQT